jgi:hypothetical protein
MIPIEQQVASRELAERMRELGCAVEGVYVWYLRYIHRERSEWSVCERARLYHAVWQRPDRVPAYSVAELLVMLPDDICIGKAEQGGYFVSNDNLYVQIYSDTAADCLAKAWIALHDQPQTNTENSK